MSMTLISLAIAAVTSAGEAAPLIPAVARGELSALVHVDDYPASARSNEEEGQVRFRLTIGANGRVTGCTITRSSGSSALDHATCQIMQRRARFTPARDSSGQPTEDRISAKIDWRLPAAE